MTAKEADIHVIEGSGDSEHMLEIWIPSLYKAATTYLLEHLKHQRPEGWYVLDLENEGELQKRVDVIPQKKKDVIVIASSEIVLFVDVISKCIRVRSMTKEELDQPRITEKVSRFPFVSLLNL